MTIDLSSLKERNQEHIKRLIATFTATRNDQIQAIEEISKQPLRRHASILAVLFQNSKTNSMDVLLTTRDRRLRSHGGETAFPGGKADEGDGGCWIWTAYREAYEEASLPFPVPSNVHPPYWLPNICSCPSRSSTSGPTNLYEGVSSTEKLFTLGVLSPQPFGPLIVLPVVALWVPKDSGQVLSTLKGGEGEVEALFSVPLERFLGGEEQEKWFESPENVIWRVSPGEDAPMHNADIRENRKSAGNDISQGMPTPILAWGMDGWVDDDGKGYHHHKVFPVPKLGQGAMYKAHSFQTCPRAGLGPVTGMSADVLISLASKTYGREPSFDIYTAGQVIGFDALVSRYEEERERSRERKAAENS